MSKDLRKLAENRKNILLAELAAWLHDVGKCADAFLQPKGMGFVAINCQDNPRVNPHKAVFSPQQLKSLPYWSTLTPQRGQCARLEEAKHSTALWKTLKNLGTYIPQKVITLDCDKFRQNFPSIAELILWGRPIVADKYKNFKNVLQQPRAYLSAILGWSHKKAHIEKDEKEKGKEPDGGSGKHIDSPLGYLKIAIQKLDDKLKEILQAVTNFIQDRKKTLRHLRKNYTQAPGDTRRPINEVTLWDWSSVVAALYKAEIARCVLTGEQREPKDVQWRLLSIRTDGLGYLLSANSIPDLLARKELLKDALDKVQVLLEEVYPLGLEVYRDENGSVFVVPDVENLLGLVDSAYNYKTLREWILEQFSMGTVNNDPCLALRGEIIPTLKIDKKPWKGQPAPEELPPVGEHIKDIPPLQSDPSWMENLWCIFQDETCTVCGLRPQGPSQKAKERKVCDVCERRRADRAKEWAQSNLDSTIWIDEVADANGRIALLVGKFDLTHWLDGTLVRSLAVRNPANVNDKTRTEDIAKNPSFARLRRIWETTRNFWEEVVKDTEENIKVNRRLRLDVEIESGELGPYHAYEIILKGVKIPVLWDENQQKLWIIDNLLYLARRWNMDIKDGNFDKVFNSVKSEFRRLEGGILKLYDPGGYGKKGRQIATVRVKDVEEDSNSYSQVIPILAEPQVFMALMPADKALNVVQAIKAKYEREMGKVRNRLPLHLGIVFAPRMMPLRAILDAGRKMLNYQTPDSSLLWKVIKIKTFGTVNDSGANGGIRALQLMRSTGILQENPNQFSVCQCIKIENRYGKQIIWKVPALMGDGKTEDHWYPYVLMGCTSLHVVQNRKRYFWGFNPWFRIGTWLVHASELKPEDQICFTPATFDFIFMDSNVRRHEIAYDKDGRRNTDPRKPYLLDELDDLQKAWEHLQELESAQRHKIIELIETKRQEWFNISGNSKDMWLQSQRDETFKEFCRVTLLNANWKKGKKPSSCEINQLTKWAISGLLADAFELYAKILKSSDHE